jgi:hypothetical protein
MISLGRSRTAKRASLADDVCPPATYLSSAIGDFLERTAKDRNAWLGGTQWV